MDDGHDALVPVEPMSLNLLRKWATDIHLGEVHPMTSAHRLARLIGYIENGGTFDVNAS